MEHPKRLGDSNSGSDGWGKTFLVIGGRDAVELDCYLADKCIVGAKGGEPVSKRGGGSPQLR